MFLEKLHNMQRIKRWVFIKLVIAVCSDGSMAAMLDGYSAVADNGYARTS